MSENEDISQWLQELKQGDREAVRKLWARYFKKLLRLARNKLPAKSRRAFDEEDVALSAFKSFCLGAERGRFPQLEDRHDLWRVLLVITKRKAQVYMRHETRLKRGGGRVMGESGFIRKDWIDAGEAIADLVSREPTPEFAVQLAQECERLLGSLGDETLRSIALLKLEGYTVEEISSQVGCARRSVERRLQIIRKAWSTDSPVLRTSP